MYFGTQFEALLHIWANMPTVCIDLWCAVAQAATLCHAVRCLLYCSLVR